MTVDTLNDKGEIFCDVSNGEITECKRCGVSDVFIIGRKGLEDEILDIHHETQILAISKLTDCKQRDVKLLFAISRQFLVF